MKKSDLKSGIIVFNEDLTHDRGHEIDVLKALKTLGYEWLARDFDRELYAFVEKPEKGETTWFNHSHLNSYIDKDLFTFIKWEDEEPTNINELLKER